MQAADIKSVGIIGAGRIGTVVAQIARRAGRQVVISNSRGPQSLTSLVQALGEGVSAGTVKDAAAADIVVLAVMWPQVGYFVPQILIDEAPIGGYTELWRLDREGRLDELLAA